jgi:cell division protein FtsQ
MAVAAPADKRFRRAHVSPVRRGRLFGSWPNAARTAAFGALLLVVLYHGVARLLSAEAVTVTRIAVSGNNRLSRGEVVSLLDGLQGQNMVLLGLEEWRQRLLASPWVADASIRRVLPGTIDVVIRERQPMGVARLGTQLYLIDVDGEVIDEFGSQYTDLDLPIVDGLSTGRARDRLVIDAERAALVGRLLSALRGRPDLARRVSQIDVRDARDAVLLLEGDNALVRVGDTQFVERLQAYLELAPVLRERVPEIDSVDLRFGDRVYVRPVERRRSGS